MKTWIGEAAPSATVSASGRVTVKMAEGTRSEFTSCYPFPSSLSLSLSLSLSTDRSRTEATDTDLIYPRANNTCRLLRRQPPTRISIPKKITFTSTSISFTHSLKTGVGCGAIDRGGVRGALFGHIRVINPPLRRPSIRLSRNDRRLLLLPSSLSGADDDDLAVTWAGANLFHRLLLPLPESSPTAPAPPGPSLDRPSSPTDFFLSLQPLSCLHSSCFRFVRPFLWAQRERTATTQGVHNKVDSSRPVCRASLLRLHELLMCSVQRASERRATDDSDERAQYNTHSLRLRPSKPYRARGGRKEEARQRQVKAERERERERARFSLFLPFSPSASASPSRRFTSSASHSSRPRLGQTGSGFLNMLDTQVR